MRVDNEDNEISRIYAIFSFKDDEVRVQYMQPAQGTAFHFLSKNGNIIYRYFFYSISLHDHYMYYKFNDNGELGLV